MLHLYYGYPHLIRDSVKAAGWYMVEVPSSFFDHFYEDHWFEDPVMIRCLQDIEQLNVRPGTVRQDMARQCTNPEILSNGVKNLFLARFGEKQVLLLSKLGDNCLPFLLEISDHREVYVCANILFRPEQEDLEGHTIHLMNYDVYTDNRDLIAECNVKADRAILGPLSPW